MAVARTVFGRIDAAFVSNAPSGFVEDAEKAGFEAFVTSRAVAMLVNAEKNRVGVAIEADFAHGLEIAGLLALAPKPVA